MENEIAIARVGATGEYAVTPYQNGKRMESQTYYTDSELDAAETLNQMYQWMLKSDGAKIRRDNTTRKILERYPQYDPEREMHESIESPRCQCESSQCDHGDQCPAPATVRVSPSYMMCSHCARKYREYTGEPSTVSEARRHRHEYLENQ